MKIQGSILSFCAILILSQFTFLYAQDELAILQYLTTWGEGGNGPSQFKDPQGISVDPSGCLYIADSGNQRIQKLNSNGEFIGEIGGYGWEKEQFDTPLDICAKNGLDVFVADFQNHRIERYDKDLHYLASLENSDEWPENLQFGFPKSVDISSHGELFCVDGENQRILKFDVFGQPQMSFGDFDSGEGQLDQPQNVLVSSRGRVYVSDVGHKCIFVYDVLSNFLFTIETKVLEKPMGMALNRDGTLFVSDAMKKQIFIFESTGLLLNDYGPQIGPLCTLVEPVDVEVWWDRLFILDKKQNAVFVFQWIRPK
jgi:tripartite motif-containing protein 71